MGNENIDKLLDCAARGAAMGGGECKGWTVPWLTLGPVLCPSLLPMLTFAFYACLTVTPGFEAIRSGKGESVKLSELFIRSQQAPSAFCSAH